MTRPARPARGDVWLADFDPAPPASGHERAGLRPAIVVSVNTYNANGERLHVVVALTSTIRSRPMYGRIDPPEGGLRVASNVLCDHVRNISYDRLPARWGRVSPATVVAIEDRLRALMGL